ncbi:MAG: UDP binding domain-containing protein [Thermoanaerobaculaceae bacterium]
MQDLGFRPRLKPGKPQIRVQGAKALSRLAPLFADEKGEKLVRLQRERTRAVRSLSDRERLTPSLFTSAVKSVERIVLDEPVFSLEVGGAHTFTTSTGLVVHNCIPLDPFYLAWKAREYGEAPKFIELAGDINVQMPHYVVQKLLLALNERGKALKGSKVLILGIAYKKDIDDPRESPAFEIIHLLLGLGAEVSYHDPHIPVAPHMRTWPHLPPMHSQPLTPETLRAADAVLIVTDHAAVDYHAVAEHAQLVVDTRGLIDPRRPNIVRA